ncbi:Mn2+/Fe2+ NRAMP family transporter [Hephaestia caeni]|uniref:Mn2+/Fe2+ NRAMP family transporter n=1 Tax=Hephaestia caeni TaxID=645617 RepID=A0A397PAX8_9SPHN|nr:Nramp family divalent metal transporter [Hephaestia caeni]RIA45543.1 Mn2+/Fe2+ NRAMP family transporter [Hephaestia caeni]
MKPAADALMPPGAGPADRPEAGLSQAPPTGLRGYLRGMGPGLVLAMTFLGTGDLVSSSVSGANYGYALMWTLIIALAARYFMISAIAKYKLQNRFGDHSLLAGYQRVWSGFPMFFAVTMLFYGMIVQAAFLRAGTVGLFELFGRHGGEWGHFFWGVPIVALTAVVLTRGSAFRFLEWSAKVASIVIVGSFLYALIRIGHIDWGALLRGLTFDVPADNGPFDALFIAVATIGTIGGSAANLLYPYFMAERGWTGPEHRKIQNFDLLSGILPLLLINILIWIVAVETIRGTGFTVSNEEGLARMMTLAVGPIGPTLLWIVFGLKAFTSFPAQAHGFAKLMFDGLHRGTARGSRHEKVTDDRWFNRAMIVFFIIVPLAITLPGAPDLVHLSIFGTSVVTALTLPPILLGILLMTSSKRFMLPQYVNRWWETLILVIISAVGIWSLYAILTNLTDAIARASAG